MTSLNKPDINKEDTNNIENNDNFDVVETKKWYSEEEQNEFRDKLEEEKNIQKEKQKNESDNLKNKLNETKLLEALIAKDGEDTVEEDVQVISKKLKPEACQKGYVIKSFWEWIESLNPKVLKLRKDDSENIIDTLKGVYQTSYWGLPNPADDPFQDSIDNANSLKKSAIASIGNLSKLQVLNENHYFDASNWTIIDKNDLHHDERVFQEKIDRIKKTKEILGLIDQKNEQKIQKLNLNNNEDIFQQFLVLDPEQFDQWLWGRRRYSTEAGEMYLSWDKQQAFKILDKQAKVIQYYIDKYPKEWPKRPKKELLYFHKAQLLAFQDKNKEAIEVITWINREHIGITEVYYKATIAFLEHDKEKLQQYYKEINDPNYELIKRFFDNIDTKKTYLKIYNNI